MQTQALTGITTGCATNHYWWIIPALFVAAIAIRAAYRGIRDRNEEVRADAMAKAIGDTWVDHFTPKPKIEMVIGDITAEYTDVIVNAAKSSLLGGGGVDGAIHKAGGPAILRECKALRADQYPDGLPAGQAVVTTGGELHAWAVIHTVGPVYDPMVDQSAILRSCYTEALAVADKLGAVTVAFPLISAGVYGWPKADAVEQALAAVRSADTSVHIVRFVFYDEATYHIARTVEEITR